MKALKQILLRASASPFFDTFIRLLEQIERERTNVLRVLTYHHVGDPDGDQIFAPALTVTPVAFAEQMRFLSKHYHVLSIQEVLKARRSGVALPPRAVLVTFDDAYIDFAKHAWPILKHYKVPATLFVPTAFPDGSKRMFWWDRLYCALRTTSREDTLVTAVGQFSLETHTQRRHAYRQLRHYIKSLPHEDAMRVVDHLCDALNVEIPPSNVLGWDALRRLAEEGVALGAHTRTHPILNRLPQNEVRAEVVGALRDLEREVGKALPIFAYPAGGYNQHVIDIVEQEGFELAFTTERGINDMNTVPELQLRRINVGSNTTLPLLRVQLVSWAMYVTDNKPLALREFFLDTMHKYGGWIFRPT